MAVRMFLCAASLGLGPLLRRPLAARTDLFNRRSRMLLGAPVIEFHGLDVRPGHDEIALDQSQGERRHRQRSFPQSSSASRFTAAQAGFFILNQSGERPER
jgi:hypothetical protein